MCTHVTNAMHLITTISKKSGWPCSFCFNDAIGSANLPTWVSVVENKVYASGNSRWYKIIRRRQNELFMTNEHLEHFSKDRKYPFLSLIKLNFYVAKYVGENVAFPRDRVAVVHRRLK
jgi:hypothetical protein